MWWVGRSKYIRQLLHWKTLNLNLMNWQLEMYSLESHELILMTDQCLLISQEITELLENNYKYFQDIHEVICMIDALMNKIMIRQHLCSHRKLKESE